MEDPDGDVPQTQTATQSQHGTALPTIAASAQGAVGRAGRYQILGELGAGTMGEVFEARDVELDRVVALKLVHPRIRNQALAERYLRQEAQAMARLSHPNVASVFDIGTVDDQLFIAMELVRGTTLRDAVRSEAPWRAKLALVLAAGRGLAAAHAAGVIHRDFKPDNVLVGNDGTVRVTDFGLARGIDDDRRAGPGVGGTRPYMAPESLDGVADERTDQYAFAISVYEVLEGRRPFRSATAVADRATTPVRWQRRGVPRALRAIIERGFAADRAARWPSVAALTAAIERRLARRLGVRLAALGALAAGVAIATWSMPVALPAGVSPRGASDPAPSFATVPQHQLTFSGHARMPSLSPDGRRLAYNDAGDQPGAFIEDLATGHVAQVLANDGSGQWLRWSPDATRLLIDDAEEMATVQVAMISAAGEKLHRLSSATSGAWSPDGTRLIFESINSGTLDVVELATGHATRRPFALPGATWLMSAEWGPGDRVLVFARGPTSFALWTVGPDGSAPRKIYEDPRSLEASDAVWAANGRAIYYERLRDQTTEIVRLALDEAGQVTGERVVLTPPGYGGGFSVTPDERALAYTRVEGKATLVVERGGRRTALVRDTHEKQGLAVSPDGKTVAFATSVGDRGELVLQSLTGGAPEVIAVAAGAPRTLAWSPDGARLAYIVQTGSARQLWIRTLATGALRRVEVSSLSAEPFHLAWTARDELVVQLDGNQNFGVVTPDRPGQPERRLLPEQPDRWVFDFQPSPDGRRLAAFWNAAAAGVWVTSLDDGTSTRIYTRAVVPLGWSRDGATVFARDTDDSVIAIDAAGSGRSRAVFAIADVVGEPVLLPDGTGWVGMAGRDHADIWLASLDPRPVALATPPATVLPAPVIEPALRNGAMTESALGGLPAHWTASGFVEDVAAQVADCGRPGERCVRLDRGAWIEQRIDATRLRGRRLRVHVRGRVEGTAGVRVYLQIGGLVRGSAERNLRASTWTPLDLDADIHPLAEAVIIRLVAFPDARAWFDDVTLEPAP